MALVRAWQSWSCDRNCMKESLFLQPMEAPYEIWLQQAFTEIQPAGSHYLVSRLQLVQSADDLSIIPYGNLWPHAYKSDN